MYIMPEGYEDAVYSMDRTVGIVISIGTGIDLTASDDITSISGDFLPMSNVVQLTDAVYSMTGGLATFEGRGIPTATNRNMVVPPISPVHNPPEVGVWSSGISDETGAMDFTMVLSFGSTHTSAFRVYTSGPNVTEASIIYDSSAQTVEYGQGYFGVRDEGSYSSITIRVSRIDQTSCHLRIVEVEFGASVSMSNDMIGGEVTSIRELDPLETSIPMDELDISIINVDGDFDIDNPNSRLAELGIGYPLTLAFSIEDPAGKRYTIPCGRYYIGEWSSSDTRVTLAAFDGRWMLSEAYAAWTLSGAVSLGQSLDELLTEYNVPHSIDPGMYSIMPEREYVFDDSTSILDDVLSIQQAYGVYLIPEHDGTLRVTTEWMSENGGAIPVDTIFSWPSPRQLNIYNFVTVGYYTLDGAGNEFVEYVSRDLRTHPSESKTPVQIVGNPLIRTRERATMLMNRLVARITTSEVETEWMGNPAVDLGDTVAIPGRWTMDDPRSYLITYQETIFDGALSMRTRGAR